MKKALIVVTSHAKLGSTDKKTGWYLPEVTHVYYPLVDAGYQIDFASPQGGEAPLDQNSFKLEDPLNKRFVDDGTIERLKKTLAPSEVNPKDYQVIYFAGGHGTVWDFPNSEGLSQITAKIYENGGIVSAVCHGPSALVNVRLSSGEYLVEGKKINSFTDAEEAAVGLKDIVPFLLETKLKARGAIFEAGQMWEDKVVVSQRLVTGQNPQSAHSLGKRIVELAQTIFTI